MRRTVRWPVSAAVLIAAWPGAAGAQVAQDANNYSLPPAQPTPTPTPSSPALPTIAPLPTPSASATPVSPVPTPSPTPTPTPATSPRVGPQPAASRTTAPAPRATPAPGPTPSTPEPTPSATPSAVPLPLPSAASAPQPSLASAAVPDQVEDFPWVWLAAGFAVVLGLLGLVWLRRRSNGAASEQSYYDLGVPDDAPASEPPVAAEPVASEPVAPIAESPRATITLAIRPRRAGLNLLSATAEVEVELVNTGALAAEEVAVDVKLLGARSGHDELLTRHFAEPIARPVTARFALAPAERRDVRAVAALPRDAMEPLVAAGRPMFVPVVAVNVRYRWDAGAGEGRGQSAAAWVVGITREGTDKLAPFWLDVQPRMHEELGAREHGLAVRQ